MKSLKSTLKYLLLLAIGAGLLYITFRKQDFTALWTALKEAEFEWAGMVLLVTLLAHFSRALRWKMLIRPLGKNPKIANIFQAMMIGYFVNFAIPRLGEVTRCTILKRTDQVNFKQALGTVVTERAIDLASLLIFVVITVLAYYDLLGNFFIDQMLQPVYEKVHNLTGISEYALLFIAVTAVGLSGVLIIWLILRSGRITGKLNKFFREIVEGLVSVFQVRNKWLFIGHTVFIWIMYVLMTYFWFFMFKSTEQFGMKEAVIIVAFGSIGRSLPIQGGGIGAYHFVVTQVVLIMGYAASTGVLLGLVIHAGQSLFYLVLGGASVITYLWSERKQKDVLTKSGTGEDIIN